MTDAISTRARAMAAELRAARLVSGVPDALEKLADTHDKLLAMVAEMQRQAQEGGAA